MPKIRKENGDNKKSANIFDMIGLERQEEKIDIKTKRTSNEIKTILKEKGMTTVSKYSKTNMIDMIKKIDKLKKDAIDYDYHHYMINDSKVSLNDEQYNIVTANMDENMRIIACAGSGKTTTVVCRIKYLIDKGVDPQRILLTTFNVDAAESMKKKVDSLFGFLPKIWIGTIDSIAYRFYNMYFKKDTFVGIAEFTTELLNFMNSYDGKKITDRFDYVFFDEFQDCSDIQFKILLKFYTSGCKVIVIGDDAQNIYQWRGSNIAFIMNFDKYVKDLKTYKLVNNYRSTPEIITFANASIIKNTDQIPKDMLSNKKSIDEKPIVEKYLNADFQAIEILKKIIKYHDEGIPYDEIAILSRINTPLKKLEEEIEKYNNDDNDKIPYVALITDDTKDTKQKIKRDHLTITSIHRSKGLEWSVVFLISCNDDSFPSEVDNIMIQEERRLFYVAITRAKKFLHISFTNKNVSRFVGEIYDGKICDFIKFKEKYIEQNDKRNLKFKSGVTELIEMIEPKDIELMRKLNILPNFKPHIEKLHSSHKYDEYVEKYYLQADFGTYLDRYVCRSFGKINEKTGGLIDMTAQLLINSVVLTSNELKIYSKYQMNIAKKLTSKLLKKSTSSLISYIDRKIDDPDYIKKIDTSDCMTLKNILEKIIHVSLKLNIQPSEIFAVSKSYLPVDFVEEMSTSYKLFTNSKNNTKDIVYDIYKVSLCESIRGGRKRLLYRDVYEYFNVDKKLYTDIDKWILQYKDHDVKIKIHLNDPIRSITGELDMYNESTNTLVDFKSSVSSECKLEWILQMLTYTALLRNLENKKVYYIQIYNPMTGTTTTFDVSGWNKENELLDMLDKIRTTKLTRTRS